MPVPTCGSTDLYGSAVSERDPSAWWSPIPGSAAPVIDVPTPRRWSWLVSAATAFVLVVCAVLAFALGRAGTQTLTDPTGSVAVAVPRSWYDDTPDPGSDPDAPPILAASNLWQSRWMEVDRFEVGATDDLRSFHAEGIDHECGGWTCTQRSGPKSLTVAGHDALEQVVTHPADADGGASSSLTLTVWLGDEAVELYAVATAVGDTPPDAAPLEAIAASLQLL